MHCMHMTRIELPANEKEAGSGVPIGVNYWPNSTGLRKAVDVGVPLVTMAKFKTLRFTVQGRPW